MERLIVFEDCWQGHLPASHVLRSAGLPLEHYRKPDRVVQAVLTRHPAAVVWAMRSHCESDVAVLQLIRLIAPEVPLLLIAHDPIDVTEATIRQLRPVFIGRLPADAVKLVEVTSGLAVTPLATL